MVDEAPEEQTPEQRRALFRVVRGEPDDAELAALTVVVAAAASAPAAEPATTGPRGVWVERAAMLRRPLYPGPDAWRTSTWPR
jgi:Acyl-CoA carboxylase epsilon subunit